MQENGVDMYLIETDDFHCSEYTGAYFKCREYISGFTGSAGTVVVTADAAGLWTGGRYFIAAAQQLEDTGIRLYKMGQPGVPTVQQYIVNTIREGQCLGFDGRTVNARAGRALVRALEAKGAHVNAKLDLVGEIWEDRPPLSHEPAWILDKAYAGRSREDKIDLIRRILKERGRDMLVVTALDDIGWLLNIRGNDIAYTPVVLAYMLIGQEMLRLYINPDVLSEEVRTALESAGVELAPYDGIYADMGRIPAGTQVICDGTQVSYAIVCSAAGGVRICDETDPIQKPKAIKNRTEIANIRNAHLKDGIAQTKFMCWLKQNAGKVPMTEISVSEKLEELRRQQPDYIEASFAPISAYGPHAAIVHYEASPETDIPVEAHGLLLMDTGAHYLDGTTDVTRTYVMGALTDRERFYFTQVLRGSLHLASAKFRYGCTGYSLDYTAREPLWQLGVDYNHGTGHGVGYLLNVHEGPNVIRWRQLPGRNEGAIMEPGMVTSDEPGVYFENEFGIRHESLLLCRKAEKNRCGQFMEFETLTLVPYDLDGVDPSLLTEEERHFLNDYHRKVFESLAPFMTADELEWLAHATRRI